MPPTATHWLQRAEPVIPPAARVLPNTEIFRRLARALRLHDPAFTASDAELMDAALDAADPRMRGLRPSRDSHGPARCAMTCGGEEAVLFGNVVPETPSGKVELDSEYLEREVRRARCPRYRPVASRRTRSR